jgi:hypothetical protein
MVRKVVNNCIKYILKNEFRLRISWALVLFYSNIIKVVKPKNGSVPLDKPTILALSPYRFRGDLNVLSDSRQFRVLELPVKWQMKLLRIFWPSNISEIRSEQYYRTSGNDKDVRFQNNLMEFLKLFLLSLYSNLKVDCVISAGVHINVDTKLGLVSEEIGVPYIVFHREAIFMHKCMEAMEHQYRGLVKFVGSHIIVHNEDMKAVFIKTGYADPDEISVLGCLRMDDLIRRIQLSNIDNRSAVLSNNKKVVTLFSFSHGSVLVGPIINGKPTLKHFSKERNEGFVKLFEHVHASIAQLAIQNKDVEFVIKPKWGDEWVEEIEYVLRKNNMDISKIKNLHIMIDIDAHDLILRSDVICGFSSTTLLESAIAGKLVIIPYFDEALKKEYTDFVEFKDSFHLFNVAHSVKEFDKLIVECLRNPIKISESQMNGRYAIFEKYVSSMSGSALDKYAETVNNIIKT